MARTNLTAGAERMWLKNVTFDNSPLVDWCVELFLSAIGSLGAKLNHEVVHLGEVVNMVLYSCFWGDKVTLNNFILHAVKVQGKPSSCLRAKASVSGGERLITEILQLGDKEMNAHICIHAYSKNGNAEKGKRESEVESTNIVFYENFKGKQNKDSQPKKEKKHSEAQPKQKGQKNGKPFSGPKGNGTTPKPQGNKGAKPSSQAAALESLLAKKMFH
jgi:hypothetical protein